MRDVVCAIVVILTFASILIPFVVLVFWCFLPLAILAIVRFRVFRKRKGQHHHHLLAGKGANIARRCPGVVTAVEHAVFNEI